jgi:transcriptional regulator with XRE-family HTH domain
MDQETIARRVARRLREFRQKAGMTVREAAAALDMDHTLIVKYENSVVAPSLARIDALARLYGYTAAALLAEQDEAIPLLAAIDQAHHVQIAQLVQALATLSEAG